MGKSQEAPTSRMQYWSDEKILSGLARPEMRNEAFRAVVEKYGPPLLGFLTKLCHGNTTRAEEILSETYLKMCKSFMGQQAPCTSLKSWLYTVAKNAAVDEFRRTAKAENENGKVKMMEEADDNALSMASWRSSTEAAHSHKEWSQALNAVLSRLTERERLLVEMEAAGIPRAEIATETRIDEKQISAYLKRAKERCAKIAREYPILTSLQAP